MVVSDCPGITRIQEKKLRLAVEGKCELCSEYFAFPFLEVHRISRRRFREMVKDPSTRILVVCHCCHQHIHCLPVNVKAQRNIVSRRSWYIRQDIRRILGYKASPYSPPGDIDVARELGFSPQQARALTLQTFLGAARLASQSEEDAATLRARVTSKNGTTERALLSMDANQVKQHIITAAHAAATRAKEMGDELGAAA